MSDTLQASQAAATATAIATIAVPVGTVVSFAGSVTPNGWLVCDGSAISQATYPALYGVVGGNLPDLRNRFIVGASPSHPLRQTGGEETHTLNVGEIPPHFHSLGIGGGWRGSSPGSGNSEGYAAQTTVFTENTTSVGSGYAHNNMPPFYALTYIIKY